MKAILVLEDGLAFEGYGFGAEGEACGEIVFNTALTGYQEIITDPSYAGQLVTMTYPHIGNYGINREDDESDKPWIEGFIIKELSPVVSNFRSTQSLDAYLKEFGKLGIEGIDTRKLVRHLRDNGAKKGIISTVDFDIQSLVKKAKASPDMEGQDLVQKVTCSKPYSLNEGIDDVYDWGSPKEAKKKYSIVAIDCGIKKNILRKFNQHGFEVEVVPATTSAEEILKKKPQGVFISNGPGDPAAVTYVVETAKGLLGKVPVFGICLGHQILGLAMGAKTFKLKFGHHGGNHPVMDLSTRQVEITSQNHGFCVDMEEMGEDELEMTHLNLNDKTLEGFQHKKMPVLSVQYHPENAPGPHDSDYLFQRFRDVIEKYG